MKPNAPSNLGAAGRRLWDAVVDDYELEEHELALLVETVRTLDALAVLEARARQDGPVIEGPQGLKAHPALVEARQQRIALARLLAVLRLPLGDEGDNQQSARQRRAGTRGVYAIKGAAS